MKTRTAGSTTNPNQGRGPSLYSVETPGKDPLEGLSILGALETGRSRSRVGKRGLLALMTVLLLVPATYLVATSSVLRQSIPMLARMTPDFKAGRAKAPGPASVPKPPAAAAAPTVAEEANVATITTELSAEKRALQEIAAASDTQPDPSQVQVTVVMAPEVEAAPEQAKASLATAASPGRRQTLQRKATKDSASVATARAKRADTRHTAVAQAHAPANAVKDGKDKDVDLIAALLTHISRPGAANKDAKSKPSATSTSSLAVADSGVKRDNPARNRDIVVQTAGESKASLISRCRSLGFLEGELCRIRICSGSWGTDPACSMDTAVRGD